LVPELGDLCPKRHHRSHSRAKHPRRGYTGVSCSLSVANNRTADRPISGLRPPALNFFSPRKTDCGLTLRGYFYARMPFSFRPSKGRKLRDADLELCRPSTFHVQSGAMMYTSKRNRTEIGPVRPIANHAKQSIFFQQQPTRGLSIVYI